MKNLTFVIVDDAIFMRIILKKMIEEDGHYTVVAEGTDGFEAVELAKKHKPDVMTLDITMPKMGGIEAVEKVLEVSPETRIIMISAMGQQSMVIEAIKAGARDFVVKPFEKSRVIQAIRNVTSKW